MCPLRMNKPELCKAALSSLMVDVKYCLNGAYVRCAIYAIESKRSNDNGGLGPLKKAEGEIMELRRGLSLERFASGVKVT